MAWFLGSWVLLSVVWWWFWKKRIVEERQRGVPIGTSGWPLIGETLEFISCGYSSRPVSFMEKRRSLYGKVFKSHILGRPMIVSTDAEVNRVILQNDGRTFVPFYPKSIRDLLGSSSILQMNGNLQKKVHGLIGGFLKSPQLKAKITQEIEKYVELSMGNWEQGQLVYIQDETKSITFQVLVRTLMGIGSGEQMQFLKREFQEFLAGLICLPIKLPGTRLYKSLKAKERIKKLVKKIIEDKMKENNKDLAMDVVDVMVNGTSDANQGKLSIDIDFICGNIIEMMIPGEDSVPMLMTLAVKYLSDCPLALKKLMEENMELKRVKTKLGEAYSWIDYMSLSFTQNVINETLRMGNIINGVMRKALKDVQIKGYLIPKEWCVMTSFSFIHLDEDNYENPYQFDPWRWQRKETSGCNFTPFGGGPRLCPGLELSRLEASIFLHHLVTRYSWVAEKDSIINFPTVRMKKRLPVTVTPIILN